MLLAKKLRTFRNREIELTLELLKCQRPVNYNFETEAMINIRKAALSDLEGVHRIETLSFEEGSYPLFVLRQLFDISKNYFFVAEEEEIIVGYVLGNMAKDSVQGWILSLGVHPEARGKKLGSRLTQKLVEILENDLSNEICLTVHPNNKSAKKIYEELGFKTVETFNNYYGNFEPRLLMKKKLISKRYNS